MVRAIAKRTGTISGGTQATGTLVYMLADHLGTTAREIAAADASVVSTTKYWPFGAPRSGTPPERGYTGQQKEANSSVGLYYYHARFYSTDMGRFVSADPIVRDSLNRYAYVLNKPTRYADPTGHCAYGLECNQETILAFLECALTCGDNWMGEGARSLLRTESYWVSVVLTQADSGWRGYQMAFLGAFMATIVQNLTPSNLWAITDRGFRTLSAMLGMSTAEGAFLAASLSDLLFGTSTIGNLTDNQIIGASRWWEENGIGSFMFLNGARLDREKVNSVKGALDHETRLVALGAREAGADINNHQLFMWSAYQWKYLDAHLPGIEIPNVVASPLEDLIGCSTDLACLQAWVRFISGAPVLPGEY